MTAEEVKQARLLLGLTLDEFASIHNEIRVVIGDKDFAAPADKLAASFPNASMVTLKNTDHFATTEAFSFIDVLLDFLSA
jgi:pimeloyl-ACP methyl ester carboxylesterase